MQRPDDNKEIIWLLREINSSLSRASMFLTELTGLLISSPRWRDDNKRGDKDGRLNK